MKIAFISYEYPPDTAHGGIATYIHQVSQLLSHRGHQVEVFASSPYREGTTSENFVLVHRICCDSPEVFRNQVVDIFTERHKAIGFEVIEGPETLAPAHKIIEEIPDIALVVKLHTPKCLIDSLMRSAIPPLIKARRILKRTLKGQNPLKIWHYDPKFDLERLHTLDADEVVILTQGMMEKVAEPWGIPSEKVSYIPNPYVPNETLLNIPIETHTNIVTFLGRLESRKGVVDLAEAIPMVLKKCPDARFRFVGKSGQALGRKMPMRQYLENKLRRYRKSVEFINGVMLEEVPTILATTDICIFPSHWENFPYVCLEAMAAGRGIVGSSAGGMAEMLKYGEAGKLVLPNHPSQIANAIITLFNQPPLRMELGRRARQCLLSEYNANRIGELLEASYKRAIQRRHHLGARNLTHTQRMFEKGYQR
jgi:glycogen(starch) synthase